MVLWWYGGTVVRWCCDVSLGPTYPQIQIENSAYACGSLGHVPSNSDCQMLCICKRIRLMHVTAWGHVPSNSDCRMLCICKRIRLMHVAAWGHVPPIVSNALHLQKNSTYACGSLDCLRATYPLLCFCCSICFSALGSCVVASPGFLHLLFCSILRGRLPFASQLGWLGLLRHGADIGQTQLCLSLLRRES